MVRFWCTLHRLEALDLLFKMVWERLQRSGATNVELTQPDHFQFCQTSYHMSPTPVN